MNDQNRRQFMKNLSLATGALVLAPVLTRCGSSSAAATGTVGIATSLPTEYPLPFTRPVGWDAMAFNRGRGNGGAIPETYLADINGPNGDASHLGKHLPYVPDIDPALIPAGFIAVMWGDPSKGHTRHPNAAANPDTGYIGHWYDWIRARRAVDGDSEEVQSSFLSWPRPEGEDSGTYLVYGDGDIAADAGKDTIYLVALPQGAAPGDEIRVHAHCLHHGEYVDFLTV